MAVARMSRVDVIAPRSSAPRVVRTIHRAGVLHLSAFEPPPGGAGTLFASELGRGGDMPAGAAFGRALERVGELAGLLALPDPSSSAVASLWELDDDELLARVAALEPTARRAGELAAERLRLTGEAARLAGYRRLVEGLRNAVGHLPAVRGYASTGIVVHARYRAVVALIREELEALTAGRCEVIAADLGQDRVAAVLLYPLRAAPEVRTLLGGRDLEEVTLPESLAGVPFDELGPRLASEEDAVRRRIEDADRALAEIAGEHGPLVAALGPVLRDRVAEAHALDEAGHSDHLVVVGGWVPADRLGELRDTLARDVGPRAVVVERPASRTAEGAPVELRNRRLVGPFEPLASFVSLPRYGTLDPTPAVALAFPVFVGLMVGDAAYGLVLLAILFLLRRRYREASWMTIAWPVGILMALSTIVFGALFGEWFGEVGRGALGLQPLWIERREAALLLLLVAIAIGLAQVAIGLVLGIVNASTLRHRREAVGRAALLACLLAIVGALAFAVGLVPAPVGELAVVVLVVALVVLTASLGLAGPIEAMGAVGNVLSYARLMAIGLASVMLALVANRLGGLIEPVLVGVLVAALFHALNIALGYFDASVQGLRLQYVEFFSKFVEPGGVPYRPFVSVLGPRPRGAGSAGGT